MGKKDQQHGGESDRQPGNEIDHLADALETSPPPPQTVYETSAMTAEEITAQNATYRAMGLSCVVVDVSHFDAKMERQADGTYKRTKLTRPRAANNGQESD